MVEMAQGAGDDAKLKCILNVSDGLKIIFPHPVCDKKKMQFVGALQH